jgi:hypothetical protein
LYRYNLAEVTRELTAGKDPEVAATLIHLMVGAVQLESA